MPKSLLPLLQGPAKDDVSDRVGSLDLPFICKKRDLGSKAKLADIAQIIGIGKIQFIVLPAGRQSNALSDRESCVCRKGMKFDLERGKASVRTAGIKNK